MTATYRGEGRRITVSAPTGGVSSGDLVFMPSHGTTALCGVAMTDAAGGADVEVELEGKHDLTKTAGATQSFVPGTIVYATTGGALTVTSSGNARVGRAAAAAATGDTTGRVILTAR